MEGRDQLKGNSQRRDQGRTQSRRTLPLNLMRVNEAAKRDPTPRLTWVTLGKSRMRESRTYGSVRAKAEWLSYSTCAVQS